MCWFNFYVVVVFALKTFLYCSRKLLFMSNFFKDKFELLLMIDLGYLKFVYKMIVVIIGQKAKT